MALNRTVPGAEALGSGGIGTAEAVLRGMNGGAGRGRWALGEMVGRSSAMERLFLQARYLANHLRVALIEGERGTGKRLLAQTLHGLTSHRGTLFVHYPASGFFAETGFAARLAEARGGTLYLSGVDALTPEEQGRLLHLLAWAQPGPSSSQPGLSRHAESRDLEASSCPRAILLSAERALRPLVLCGKFRSDLQAQLSLVHMTLPPLRDRLVDVPVLAERFLERWNARCRREGGRALRGFAPDLLPWLMSQRWSGNVRELETTLAQAAAQCEGEWLRARHAAPTAGLVPSVWVARPGEGARLREAARVAAGPQPVARPASRMEMEPAGDAGPDSPLDPNLDRAILRHIRRVLGSVDGNKLRAARLLGISRSTLYRLLDSDNPMRAPV